LEQHPGLLSDDEPLLVIGRQVNTALGGTIDLLALDADGSTVIVELKRAPTPRDLVAQVIEYAAWVAGLSHDEVGSMAEHYLAQRPSRPSLAEAWGQTFANQDGEEDAPPELPAGVRLNGRQRLIVVAEGANERILTVARYLRSAGVDITVLDYAYYRTGSGEELLNVEQRVGQETMPPVDRTRPPLTEERLIELWGAEGAASYVAFRDTLLDGCDLTIAPRKTAISFYKHARDGRVFVCQFSITKRGVDVSLRNGSLAPHIDVHATIAAIEGELPSDSHVARYSFFWTIRTPATVERAHMLAHLLLEHVAKHIQ
jgi:hypothetical protein